MGREIKRVEAGFSWLLGKPWKGFQNPYYTAIKCETCVGDGASPEAKRFSDEWYGYVPFSPRSNGSVPFGWDHPLILEFASVNILFDFDTRTMRERTAFLDEKITAEAMRLAGMFDQMWIHHLSQVDVDALIAHGRLMELTHTWQPEVGWKPKEPPHHPTAKEVNEWSVKRGLGHDGSNQWICTRARCERAGVSDECAVCQGHGHHWPSEEAKRLYDAWEREQPPAGEWWQLWETVSEGSPVTPAFATAEELASWCVKNQIDSSSSRKWNRLAGGDSELSYDRWMAFITGDGWAPSAVSTDGVFQSGVEAVTAGK